MELANEYDMKQQNSNGEKKIKDQYNSRTNNREKQH